MELAKIVVHATTGVCAMRKRIPAGIVGATVSVEFRDPIWDRLSKTVVFRGSDTVISEFDGRNAVIPWEVVQEPGQRVFFGIWGSDPESDLQLPLIEVDIGSTEIATDPNADPGTDPTLPIWGQLKEEVDRLKESGTGGGTGKPGDDGGYYTPSVSQPDQETVQFDFTPSKADMPAVEPATVKLPKPDSGGNADYVLPVGGAELGGVKNGGNVVINDDGTMTAPDAIAVDTTLTQSGKAADAKVMGDKTNWYVTPEMYGAVGDGVADDTLPVTYALNSGKLVYFGYKRTYLITSSLRVATGYRTFIGNGATIKLADGVDDNVMTLSAGVRNLTIERLTLCGNKANQNGLYFDGNVVGCRFYQVCFKQNGKSGIKVTTVTYANQIVECEFDENGEHGFDGVVEDNTKHCVSTTDFHLCRFTRNGMSGLNINGSTNKVFGGWFEGNDVGIIFSAEHYSTGSTGLFGVDIEGNKSHGIKFMVTDGYTMDSIQIIGGQLFGSTTNVSVLHFDIPAYKNIINISIDSRLETYGGVTIDAVNPAFVYAKQFPVEKLPSGTKLRVFVGVNDQYVTDSDVQRYIVGAKPTFVDAYKQCSYTLSPGECVTVRFDTPAYCAKIKCTSDSSIQLIATVIVSGKFISNNTPVPTVANGVHEFSLNTDTPFIMLKNTGDTETVISNILFTGRLPVL